jgi:Mn-dependent DtxR family transcriptional regulator
MECIDGLELSPRKVEYLKFVLERGERVNTNDLAGRFRVDPSTITKTMGELSQAGYLTHMPYRGVCLTGMGKEYAEFLIRRHRILGLILTHYGLSPEKACEEVSRFESFVSKGAVDTMCRALGHPVMGLCGTIPHDECCCPEVKREQSTADGTTPEEVPR